MAMNLDIPVLVIVRISTSILAYGSLPLILTVNANQLDLDKPSDPHWQEFQQKTGHAKAMDIGELPVGHMRPLGAHQAPEGHVEMLDVMPTPQELYEKYIRESKAVVLKNACNKYGATRKWDDIYLR